MFRRIEPIVLKMLAGFSFILGIVYNLMGAFGHIRRNDMNLTFFEAMGSMAVMSLLFFGLGFTLLFLERRLSGKRQTFPGWYLLVLTYSAALLFLSAGLAGKIATAILYAAVSVTLLVFLSRSKQSVADEEPKVKEKKSQKKEKIPKKEFPFSALAEKINDAALKKDVQDIEKIIREIYQNKEMRRIDPQRIKKIETYYLPTLTSLLNTYLNLEESHLGLEREQKLKEDIHSGITSIKQGFYQICENTYQSTSMNISAELSALENILASDGLLTDDIRKFYIEKNKEKTPS